MNIKNITLAAVLLVIMNSGYATGINASENALSETEHQELRVVKKSPFDEAYTGDIAKVKESKKIYIENLIMDDVDIDQPDVRGIARLRTWELTNKDKEGLNELYREAIRKQIEALEGYTVVAEPGEDVTSITAELLALNPSAPKDDFKSRSGREKYISEGAGSATIAIEVSKNGEILLKAKDRRDAGHSWGINDRFHNKQDVKRLFNHWARSIVRQLDIKHS